MPDTIVKTTNQSWFSRVGSAFAGVVVGLILIVVCVGGLAWNEGRAVKTERALKEGAGLVIDVEADPVVTANDQGLVHVTGAVAVTAPLVDDAFGVTGTGVHLARQVEMYQWTETSKSESRTKLGGGEETVTTYTYAKGWSGQAQDSSAFAEPGGHENPEFAVESADFLAQDATLGAFALDDNVVGQIGGAAPLRLTQDNLEAVQAAAGDDRYVSISQNRIVLSDSPMRAEAVTTDETTTDETAADDAATDEATTETTTRTVAQPATVGDVRIGYELTPAAEISVVAKQNGDGFLPYRAGNGEEFLLVSDGDVPAADMFAGAQDTNRIITWIVRVVGMVLLMVGFGLILAPLGVLADVLPLAGTIVRMGTGLIGFVLGLLVGSVTIALAWLAFRPLLTVGILVVAGAIAFAAWRFGRGRDKKKQAAAATA